MNFRNNPAKNGTFNFCDYFTVSYAFPISKVGCLVLPWHKQRHLKTFQVESVSHPFGSQGVKASMSVLNDTSKSRNKPRILFFVSRRVGSGKYVRQGIPKRHQAIVPFLPWGTYCVINNTDFFLRFCVTSIYLLCWGWNSLIWFRSYGCRKRDNN